MKRLVLILALLCAPAAYGQSAPTFTSFSAIAASTGADVAVTLGTNAANDIMLMGCLVRDQDDTATVSGWTPFTGSPWDRSTVSRYWTFWKRSTGGETTATFDKSGATGDTYCAVIVYSGAIATGDPWEVVGSGQSGTSDPGVYTGITSLTANALIVAYVGGEDNNNASIITTGTDPSAYAEHYVETTTGDDGVITFSEAARSAAGATGDISVNWNTANPVGQGAMVFALKPLPLPCASTSFGNGYTCVQAKYNTNGGSASSVTVTLDAGTTAGNAVFMFYFSCVDSGCSTNTATTMTFSNVAVDSFVNSPQSCFSLQGTGTRKMCIGATYNVSGGETQFTCTPNAARWYIRCFAVEWQMPSGTKSFDVDGGATGSSGTPSASLSGTTAQAVELILGYLENGNPRAITPGANFTEIFEPETGHMIEARVVTSTGTYACDGTHTSDSWNAVCMAAKSVAAAGGGPPTQMTMGVGD